jgi:hypothetical protein
MLGVRGCLACTTCWSAACAVLINLVRGRVFGDVGGFITMVTVVKKHEGTVETDRDLAFPSF